VSGVLNTTAKERAEVGEKFNRNSFLGGAYSKIDHVKLLRVRMPGNERGQHD